VTEHGYEQYCGLARALDVVGDRWALLIVRELMLGPRRFTDLLDGLPGISRKVITERLRALESDGVIARAQLPPPAARQVYQLTGEGRDLVAAMIPLVAWGARRLGARRPTESFRPQWAALAMALFADTDAAAEVDETYQILVDSSAFHFIVGNGTVQLRDGRADAPAVTLTTDEQTWTEIACGAITASAAVDAGRLAVAGNRQAGHRLKRIMSRDRVLAGAEKRIGSQSPSAAPPMTRAAATASQNPAGDAR
jgi:DNA-binding HxlR family transcriptional regulator/putative sterol carrier protein